MTKLTQEKAESLKEKPATGKGMEVPVHPARPAPRASFQVLSVYRDAFSFVPLQGTERTIL